MRIETFVSVFLLGVLLEVLLFSRNEWDRRAPRVLLSFCLLFAGIFIALVARWDSSFIKIVLDTWILGFTLLSGLFASMLLYRLLLHPLKSIPGPWAARVTSFWFFKECIPDLRFYMKLRDLHAQYGDFVRIRPREISICHPDAVADVHGPKNKIQKGDFYDHIAPFKSLQLTRDPIYHKSQRKYWDRAFHTKALQEYTPRLVKHYIIFMGILNHHAASNTPVDASQSLLDLFFDIVSDLTFGKSFNTLTTKKRNPIIGEFIKRQKVGGYMLTSSMWVFHLVQCLPIVQRYVKEWVSWYGNALEERRKMEHISPDFYTYISQSEGWDIHGTYEAQLAIIAGADTNAITVSNVCHLLCQHPEYQERLYREVYDLPISGEIIHDQYLIDKPLLMGIIHEALRLYPPVPRGLQRVTPPEGAWIAGQFIPGEMIVTTPTYSLQRDARAFIEPDQFIPERWYSKPELILRKDAFIAFGYGAYNCAGKPLAMLQLRMVIAMIVRNFWMSFPVDKNAECQQFIDDQADCFTLHLNALPLLLEKRLKSN